MRLRLAFLAGTMLAMPAFAADMQTLTCEAPFNKNMTEADLVAAFGKENVEYKSVPGAEGMETNATVVFPNDPARRLTVHWWDEDKRARPAAVSVEADFGDDPDGMNPWKTEILWQTVEGLRIGSDLAAVEKANGKPFRLSGFGWDFGGFAISWDNGALDAAQRHDCNLTMRFLPSAESSPESVVGDVELMSDMKDVIAAKPRVTELTISYPGE